MVVRLGLGLRRIMWVQPPQLSAFEPQKPPKYPTKSPAEILDTAHLFCPCTQCLNEFQSGKEIQNAGLYHSSVLSATAVQIYDKVMTAQKEQAVGGVPTGFTVRIMCQRCLDQPAFPVSVFVKEFRPVFAVGFHSRSFGIQIKWCSCQIGTAD